MAIDTAQKRFSMSSFGDGDSAIMFQADAVVDPDDRFHLLGLYGGLELATTTANFLCLLIGVEPSIMQDISCKPSVEALLQSTPSIVSDVSIGCDC